MARKKGLGWIGALLIFAGLALMIFSGYTYIQNTRAEANAEARVPGQSNLGSETTKVPEAPTRATPSPVILLPDLSGDESTPMTPVPTSTETPGATQAVALPTGTPQMVVGPEGLPIGAGADAVRIVIPRLKLDTKVQQANWGIVNEGSQAVSDWFIPYDAVGHLITTAQPGEAGNAVISGHHNLIGPNVFGVGKFAGLWNLRIGDSIYIFDNLGRAFKFRVTEAFPLHELGESFTVRAQHAQQVMQSDGKAILTLETCWNGAKAPLSGNAYRWIIRSELLGTIDAGTVPEFKS